MSRYSRHSTMYILNSTGSEARLNGLTLATPSDDRTPYVIGGMLVARTRGASTYIVLCIMPSDLLYLLYHDKYPGATCNMQQTWYILHSTIIMYIVCAGHLFAGASSNLATGGRWRLLYEELSFRRPYHEL